MQRYLAEFQYRFNRRFDLRSLIPRLAYVALRTPPMPEQADTCSAIDSSRDFAMFWNALLEARYSASTAKIYVTED